jgi:tetratricopeptide (TPR) repeat protein
MGFFNVYPMRYSFVADHFQYLAIMFVLIAVAAGARWLATGIHPFPAFVAGAAVLVGMAALSFIHARAFADAPTLWRDTLAKNDRAWIAWTNLGNHLQQVNRYDDAIAMYKHSLTVWPEDDHALTELAVTYSLQGKHQTALDAYHHGLLLAPNSKLLWNNMAAELGTQGDFAAAESASRRALAIDPDYVAARVNLAQALASDGRGSEAESEYRRAIELDLDHSATPRMGLAVQLANRGQIKEAIEQLRAALELEPESQTARSLLVAMLRQTGQFNEAGRVAAER